MYTFDTKKMKREEKRLEREVTLVSFSHCNRVYSTAVKGSTSLYLVFVTCALTCFSIFVLCVPRHSAYKSMHRSPSSCFPLFLPSSH